MNQRPTPASGTARPRGLHVGPIAVTLPLLVVLVVLVGSLVFIGWVVLNANDDQFRLLAVGFVALGASFVAIAVGSLTGMWRAASRAQGGRSFALALVGGLAGLAAIGSFSVTVLLMLVWNT